MASDDHRFLSSSLYSSGTLVAWDPAPFSADLMQVKKTGNGCKPLLVVLHYSDMLKQSSLLAIVFSEPYFNVLINDG